MGVSSYLLNRTQVVSISGVLSDSKTINIGVPQGSILGPLLFLIYINDLADCLSPHTESLLYADDTTIFTAHDSIPALTSQLNSDLQSVISWCHKNKLVINPSKTKYVIFSSRSKKRDNALPVYVNNHEIFPSDKCTFLGIELDCFLNFNEHINQIKRKTAYGIRVLLRARQYFALPTLTSLYFAFLHSHFNYCIESWGLTYKTYLSPLAHIQKQALRIITHSNYHAHSAPLFSSLNIFPISNIIVFNLAVIAYRMVRNPNLLYVVGKKFTTSSNNTRFSLQSNIFPPKARTNYGQKTVSFSAIKVWNTLPLEARTSPSLYAFKHSVRLFLNHPLDI